MRAAAKRLGGRHRRMDPERAGDVVRCCDHTATVGVAADDQGKGAQGRVLELLDRGKKRIQVEMSDNHVGRLEMRLAVIGLGVMVLVAAGCGAERRQPAATKAPPATTHTTSTAALVTVAPK